MSLSKYGFNVGGQRDSQLQAITAAVNNRIKLGQTVKKKREKAFLGSLHAHKGLFYERLFLSNMRGNIYFPLEVY